MLLFCLAEKPVAPINQRASAISVADCCEIAQAADSCDAAQRSALSSLPFKLSKY
jgi:hypothetical protein